MKNVITENQATATDPSVTYTVNLGKNVRVPFDSVLKAPKIDIGDNTRINGPINIRGRANCFIGKYCAFGYGIHILSTNHLINRPNLQIAMNRKFGFVDLEYDKGPVCIGNNVWLGDSVTVLSGTRIGNGAVVGAGSVVTNNIPPFAIAYGVPAKVTSHRFPEPVIKILKEICWWDWTDEKIKKNQAFFNADLTEINPDEIKSMIND